MENTESTQRQYDLRRRAIALGWPSEHVIVIDHDLGQSGASATDRKGFQNLVTEVGLGRAGIVMGLEVSRLARNSTDWHRLLEICALTDTLILDEDGIYDPSHFNDRLLLGLKGTMSEAELHVLKARLVGGMLNKARRGELQSPLPVGFVYDPEGRVRLDPDEQVQQTIRLLFQTFLRTGSAFATVREFRREGVRFPCRLRHGPHKGEILWGDLRHSRTLEILHNPRYAGAFCWGRTRQRRRGDGQKVYHLLPREEWIALVPDAHPGYITWEQFEENQLRLKENSAAHGLDRRRSPPREGPALLQGLVICGRCGARMTVRYHQRGEVQYPDYVCAREGIEHGESPCQVVVGAGVDEAIGKLLVETMTPIALEVALAVHAELQTRVDDADRVRRRQVERARYETEVARRRYMQVDPDNRLVADALEADWNETLRALAAAEEECERQRVADGAVLGPEQKERVLALATDFPRLWKDPNTPARERKRMVRLLIEDVTLTKSTAIRVQIRFRGGKTEEISVPLPLSAWQLRQTDPHVVAEIDRLLDHHTDTEIARLLDERGFRTGEGHRPHRLAVRRIRKAYGLQSRYDRLRAQGLLTRQEVARALDVRPSTVNMWRRAGLIQGVVADDRGLCLYPVPGDTAPVRYQHKGVCRKIREQRISREHAAGGAV
jgi:DNA invertase Pin-like site-specific DNA recombinase